MSTTTDDERTSVRGPLKALRDTWLVYERAMRLQIRQPVWIFVGIFQPVMYLLLFAPLLEPALAPLGVSGESETYRVFVPGLLVLLALFGGLFQGFGLIAELRAGIVERSRVTPVSRLAMLLGRSLKDATSLLVQAMLLTGLATFFGLTAHIGHLLLAFLMLAVIAMLTSSVSYATALRLRSEDTLAPVMNTVALPLLLLSGILLPIQEPFAPGWLETLSQFNPFSWAVDGVRALFAGQLGDDSVWQGLLVVVALAVLALVWAARSFARTVR